MGEQSFDVTKSLSAKQYLEQLEIIDVKIRQMEEELESLRSNVCSVGSVEYGREKVQTSRPNDLSLIHISEPTRLQLSA